MEMERARIVFPCRFAGCNKTCLSASARIRHQSSHKISEKDRCQETPMEDENMLAEERPMQPGDAANEDSCIDQDEGYESEVEECISGAVLEIEAVNGDHGFDDDESSECSFMHDSDWDEDEDEEEIKAGEEEKQGPRKMLHVVPDFCLCSDKFLNYKGPDERLGQLPQEIKEAGYLINKLVLSRSAMAAVNEYVRFQFRQHGCDPPKRLPEKRTVVSAIGSACDRTLDGTKRLHKFDVPPRTIGCKAKTVTFEVSVVLSKKNSII